MARKTVTSYFDVDFEVILIIVLIVVAILLVLFLNRTFSKERFLLRNAQRMETFQNENTIPTVSPATKVYFFYANWCGYSTRYLSNTYPDLQKKLTSNALNDRFVDCDVDNQPGKKYAQEAGVTGLPSFYTYKDGTYTKMTFPNGIDNDQIIEWMLEN